jgi:hypothetical protein
MDTEDTGRRADLEAAFDKVEQASAPTPEPIQESVAIPDAPIGDKAEDEAAAQKARDDKGRFAKIGDKSPESTPKVVEAKPVEAKVVTPAIPTPTPESTLPKIAPPRSLKATTREGWQKLPREMQEDIAVWDRETLKTKSEAAQAMQFREQYQQHIGPFEQVFRQQGVEPLQGLNNIVRAAVPLYTGSAQDRVGVIAGLIRDFKVDIGMLDSALSGQAIPQQAQPAYDPGMIARQAQEAVKRELQQYQQQAAQRTAAEQLSAFEATEPEFFDDLRDDMSRLLESGFAKDYNDAYNKAQLLNPTVARVIEQRKAAASVNGAQRAQAAASSVKAQPAIGIAATQERDRRGDLEDAWNKIHGGSR